MATPALGDIGFLREVASLARSKSFSQAQRRRILDKIAALKPAGYDAEAGPTDWTFRKL